MKIVDAMSLKDLLIGREGRIGRRTWWLWGVAMPIGMGLYFTVLLRVAGLAPRNTDILVNLLLFWPTLAVSVKRWHDRGKSGWWVLMALVPFIGWVWVLVENGLLRGDKAANRFGEPPPLPAGSKCRPEAKDRRTIPLAAREEISTSP